MSCRRDSKHIPEDLWLCLSLLLQICWATVKWQTAFCILAPFRVMVAGSDSPIWQGSLLRNQPCENHAVWMISLRYCCQPGCALDMFLGCCQGNQCKAVRKCTSYLACCCSLIHHIKVFWFLFKKKAFSKGNIRHYIVYRDQQVLHSLWCYQALSSANQLIYTTTAFLLQIEGRIWCNLKP